MAERLCELESCRKPLVRRDNESTWHFERRRHCGQACNASANATRRGSVVWTVGMVRVAHEMVHRGATSQQIADALKKQGYSSVTRNSVIGVIYRKGLRELPPEKEKPAPVAAVPDEAPRRIEADAKRPRFGCATEGCRNTKQPGRSHCAQCITAGIAAAKEVEKASEEPYKRVR